MLTWIFALNFLEKNVKIYESAQVPIQVCAAKGVFCTHKVKHERESEGNRNAGNSKPRLNMYVGSNRWRYVIFWATVYAGILRMRR